ncbi:MAG: hypothetical protein AAGF67_09920, partial [Verrucomicrobiota bacterium]
NAKLKPLKQEFEAIESSIAKLEEEKEGLTAKLADPDFFKQEGAEASDAMKRFSEVEGELESSYTSWEELSEKIELIESE